MQFLYPIGLLTLASLAIPVIIHLWRIKQGKTLKIGSISLLGQSAATHSRSLRLNDWLLFLLRCILLMLIAFLMAKPYLKGKAIANSPGWILLNPSALKTVYHHQRSTIDSLLNKGYEIHEFAQGFKSLHLKDTTNQIAIADTPALSSVSLLKQVNHLLPNRYPVWLFTTKDMLPKDEILPTLHLQLHWNVLDSAKAAPTHYVQYLHRTYMASWSKNAITYKPLDNPKLPALQVMLYPSAGEEVRYMKSALMAIGDYIGQKIIFHQQPPTGIPLDAIFWLSDKALDTTLSHSIKPQGLMFQCKQGKTNTQQSTVVFNQETLGELQPIQVFKAVHAANEKGEILWKDGFGRPLLTLQPKGNYRSYTFYSRFNPTWTEMVWNPYFVRALLPILYTNDASGFGFDQTPNITSNHAIPVLDFTNLPNEKGPTPSSVPQPVHQYLWVLAFVILVIERFLTFKSGRKMEGSKE